MLEKINTDNITETNDLIYAAAVVVSEHLGVKFGSNKNEKEPWWKRRLGSQIQQLRKDINRVQRSKEGMMIKTRYREELQKKYWLKEKGYKRVIDELKQRVTAKTAKVRR